MLKLRFLYLFQIKEVWDILLIERLKIEPDSIDYLNNSSYEEKEKIYNLLNRNKIHILELSICRFKFDQNNIKNILGLLKIIFIGNKNNNNQNKEHFVKKFNFLDNNLEN